jgi:hypothetical protein
MGIFHYKIVLRDINKAKGKYFSWVNTPAEVVSA